MEKIRKKIKILTSKVYYELLKKLSLILSDKQFIELKYLYKFRKKLNLENPKTFNEKIQWRIIHDRKNIYTQLADKYLVREYVKNKIGENYLIKILGVYKDPNEVEYDKLPNRFVMKCNHDAGSVIICLDKKKIDINKVNKKLKFFLKRNFYYFSREWHYKNIKPLIICEEFKPIFEKDRFGNELPEDYKLHCFNGEVKFLEVQFNRFDGKRRINIYDPDWNLLEFKMGSKNVNYYVEKPIQLEEMKKLARILSREFDYCRVDFYISEEKVYFGEITFTPCSGFDKFQPKEWDYKLGQMWELDRNEK
ncbi:MAG: ATP-grasp fold amidoligase family protein [Cetobacterium sp.]